MGMLDGKVAIVTGAGNGVGRGEAVQLADHGAKVVVNDLGGSVTGEGADKRAAAEFSFFLAIPTMVGAFVYEFYKNRADISLDHAGVIAIGFVVSFITAMIVVKTFLTYVTRHGFVLFAWWRVIVGTLGLVALAMGR